MKRNSHSLLVVGIFIVFLSALPWNAPAAPKSKPAKKTPAVKTGKAEELMKQKAAHEKLIKEMDELDRQEAEMLRRMAAADRQEAEMLKRMAEADRQEKEMADMMAMDDLIDNSRNCISRNDFTCSRTSLEAAKRYAKDNRAINQLNLAWDYHKSKQEIHAEQERIAMERKRLKEEEDRRLAQLALEQKRRREAEERAEEQRLMEQAEERRERRAAEERLAREEERQRDRDGMDNINAILKGIQSGMATNSAIDQIMQNTQRDINRIVAKSEAKTAREKQERLQQQAANEKARQLAQQQAAAENARMRLAEEQRRANAEKAAREERRRQERIAACPRPGDTSANFFESIAGRLTIGMHRIQEATSKEQWDQLKKSIKTSINGPSINEWRGVVDAVKPFLAWGNKAASGCEGMTKSCGSVPLDLRLDEIALETKCVGFGDRLACERELQNFIQRVESMAPYQNCAYQYAAWYRGELAAGREPGR